MALSMTSPVADTFQFDQMLDINFDTLTDPALLFDFDAYAGGLAPQAESSSVLETTRSEADTATTPNFDSLFGSVSEATLSHVSITLADETGLALPEVVTTESPVLQRQDSSLHQSVLTSHPTVTRPEAKDFTYEQDLDALFAELSGPIEESLLQAEPTCQSLPLQPTSWPKHEVNTSFAWNAESTVTGADFFSAPQSSGRPLLDGLFGAFDYSLQHTFYPSPKGTEIVIAPTPPQSQLRDSFDSLVPNLASASTGDISFTHDDSLADVVCSLPPAISTISQSVVPRSILTAAATATTELLHPKPRFPICADIVRSREEGDASPAPSSILDSQGFVRATSVSSFYLTPVPTPARNLSTPVVDGKVIKRIPKPAKAKDVDPNKWYDTLPETPTGWGGSDPTGNPLFRYNSMGELHPSLRFGRDEILYYMRERKSRNLPLTLWIQNVPHGCKSRVADDRARGCRWSGCPAQKGTILKGFWRVCFDERPATSGNQHNPYHNAGYMHLWCLDRCFDLFEITCAFDLRPDTRHFEKEQRNSMAMTRDHDELVMVFEEWRALQQKAYDEWQELLKTNTLLGLPTANRVVEKESKLWYMLTSKHLDLETKVRQDMRQKRNGISIDLHRGDLEWYVAEFEGRKLIKKEQSTGLKGLCKPAGRGSAKRSNNAPDCDDEDESDVEPNKVNRRKRNRVDDSEDESMGFEAQTPHRSKRSRRSRCSI
ncbi:hypothetical protein CCHL11_03011 [Colletotrichum chlorophyti]|uniref:Uncharacterized protein n=1 Tax=Colletotrichum chlorophyti TaxID=708187 RepID=A0A1Q8RGD5_9PEZI|nr:hypothetical protein CCHL11_03011 [Colletotrichum chlorophyti]